MAVTRFITCAVGVATLALLGGCHRHRHPDTAAIAATIKADTAAMVAAYNARDIARSVVAVDAPDYVGMMHGYPNIIGRDGDVADAKANFADPAMKIVIADPSVAVAKAGDMAVYRATYAYTFTNTKTKAVETERGNWLLGWKQDHGKWLIAWSVIADIPR